MKGRASAVYAHTHTRTHTESRKRYWLPYQWLDYRRREYL